MLEANPRNISYMYIYMTYACMGVFVDVFVLGICFLFLFFSTFFVYFVVLLFLFFSMLLVWVKATPGKELQLTRGKGM